MLQPLYNFHITDLLFSVLVPIGSGQMLSPDKINSCPGDAVNLTCEVHAQHLIWMSEEYIGTHGQQLEFLVYSQHGEQKVSKSDPNAVAILVEANNMTVMSQFQITVNRSGTIICKDGNSNTYESTIINLISKSISK